ncbi:MAG: 4-hydroxy-4-methyl-2-oxoglutarate aldolase/4-carboxy-4-hydroxy-2-oxoadipate aldolase [Paracidovorax wautersii]|uniref:4-hydroxy-4-methyl-2-oxoglutarate aldolase/4-carboxy-4-hydroxy-2-oxoadipate aldolase n=1 Tax=Paracidovorax wautersii TaxID=1177982 RepID=A0A7V8JPZ1_9BURK|nr:MAG: 4-hydroxy-4-methyl-2-oxoglutarate aldolase/4-carboxy-4-hydroxy-2-oxoadipate aldolase [Paracidovorax wautersii]
MNATTPAPLAEIPRHAPAPHVPDAVLDRLARASSGSLTTQLYIKGIRQPVLHGLKPLNKKIKPFAGRAYTMRFIPAREDIDQYGNLTTTPSADNLQWVGVEQIEPGHVLVIDSNQDGRAASMGNMLITRMKVRGARAVITDGSFRDGTELSEMDFPIWSTGVTATTRLSYHHVADLNVPIGCAGVAVYPGDVIHGDGDNITVIPAHMAEEMAALCEQRDDIEAYLALRVQAGEALWGLYPPSEQTRRQHRDWVAAGRPPIATGR